MKLGKAFSDNVFEEKHRETKLTFDHTSWWLGVGRALLFTTLLVVVLFILIWRLFFLTVISGHTYRKLADDNRIRELVRHAPRGEFLDRTGRKLVYNTPHFRLLKPCDTDAKQQCTTRISEEEGEALKKKGLPTGWFLEVDWTRTYAMPESIAHVVGYVGEIAPEELVDEYYAIRMYKAGDQIGRMGAEAAFEDKLRGRDGRELVEVDAEGNILRTLGRDLEVPGETITLALDGRLSEAVADAFPKDLTGAVVVSKPSTGEILALYSHPSFSPSLFSSGTMTNDVYTHLIQDEKKPMFNRAIGGVYPPGSTFKLITAIAGLEEGAIKKDTLVEDTGEIAIGPYKFGNWYFLQYGKTDGSVDVEKALQRSNDIYFYKAGEWLGITKLSSWMRKFGLGAPLGIEIGGEAGGLVPDPTWKQKRFSTPEDITARNDQWYLGDTYHLSIGQGYMLTTPLQVNAWTNVVANGGKLCKPTILSQKVKITPNVCKDIGIKKETIDTVRRGMEQACDTGGTGYPFFDFGVRKEKTEEGYVATSSGTLIRIPVACKTGTAEYGSVESTITHAWFTAFAPVPSGTGQALNSTGQAPLSVEKSSPLIGEPEISVTVLLEGAGQGSDKAAPIAKKIMEAWFSR